jgi:putative membrane protein
MRTSNRHRTRRRPTSSVNKAVDGDMFEIQSSKLALQMHPDRDTRPFASKMVRDHTKTSKQLPAFATSGKVNAELPTTLDADHKSKPGCAPRIQRQAI